MVGIENQITEGSKRAGIPQLAYTEPDMDDIEPYLDASPQQMLQILQVRSAILDRVHERRITLAIAERQEAEADGAFDRIKQQDMQLDLLKNLEDDPPPSLWLKLAWAMKVRRRPMGPNRRQRIEGQILAPHKVRELAGRMGECRSRARLSREKAIQYELEIMAYVFSLRRESPQPTG
jgi:hypothetical protein